MTGPGRAGAGGRGVPSGFLGMAMIVVVVESILHARALDFTNEPAADWRLTSAAASREALDAEILCFGDSLVKFGVVPSLIEGRTGLRTFNLSVLGGQAASSYFLLRRALEAGARPRAVLVDCQDRPAVSGRDEPPVGLWDHARDWPEMLDTRDMLELSRSARDVSFFLATALARVFPSIKARGEIPRHVRKAFRRRGSDARYLATIQRRNWSVNRGGMLLAPKESARTTIDRSLAEAPPSDWRIDPLTREYLRKFVATARGRGIAVFWLLPPTSPEHEALRDRVGQRDYYTEVARALQVEFPGMVVIDARGTGYARRLFVDDTHLDRVGASAWSDDLGGAVAAALGSGGGGWIGLPSYRERPAPGRLEDLDGSRMAVDPKWRARR